MKAVCHVTSNLTPVIILTVISYVQKHTHLCTQSCPLSLGRTWTLQVSGRFFFRHCSRAYQPSLRAWEAVKYSESPTTWPLCLWDLEMMEHQPQRRAAVFVKVMAGFIHRFSSQHKSAHLREHWTLLKMFIFGSRQPALMQQCSKFPSRD